jgi:hypothetical protein
MTINSKLKPALLAAATAGLLAACGGGGGYGGDDPPPPPARQAPQITGLTDQALPQDTSTPVLTFQVSDADSGAASIALTALSSDANLLPADGIVLGGSGASRTLQITPAAEAIGDAMITIRAADPDGLVATQAIRVTVNGVFVSFRGTVNEVFPVAETGDQRILSGFTFTQDVDDEPTAFDTLL